MSVSCPNATFSSRELFCGTQRGAMLCGSLGFNSFAVCSQKPESLYPLFYFVFIFNVSLLMACTSLLGKSKVESRFGEVLNLRNEVF